MRVREESVVRVVRDTQDFSFAYLKELFVTSMVQWMSSGGAGSMDEVLIGQTELLRSQMKTMKKKASGSSRK
jgi:hypothetical protein